MAQPAHRPADGGLLSGGPRLVVAGWTGSTNLGDELLLDALRRLLEPVGAELLPISVDAPETRRDHGLEAVPERRPDRLLRALRDADGLIFGPGGLLQDDSSPLNPGRHLARVLAARALSVPVRGLGLGVGPLDGAVNQRLARRVLAGVPLVVRDAHSADVVAALGLPRPEVTADLVFGLPDPSAAPADRIVVCLRPPTARRFGPEPAAARRERVIGAARRHAVPALAALSGALDLPVHLVAFEAGRDDLVGESVADALAAHGVEVTTATPDRHTVIDEVAASRLVVSMRYHGGIAALLAGRPTVLVGHVDKVRTLVADAGVPGVAGISNDDDGWRGLAEVAERAIVASSTVIEARDLLRTRARRHDALVERWWATTRR
ncbi:polysaccharide pyruvyl transferase family protein [Actinomarinicola tropica]|uniref:Polysaccharide pyruvyl transferase domain-containing protein n=1 Tax=Actinomarinicola tropica TaxID=2789776 RepID=A0A5Q2RLQ0_9ACTN|nr:polysaccharide pyruvyl transferase family protein [Actinomarinicola tropica]QGG95852.1 hypothetical protein GH723_12505 [Actinomarinicola tropica]